MKLEPRLYGLIAALLFVSLAGKWVLEPSTNVNIFETEFLKKIETGLMAEGYTVLYSADQKALQLMKGACFAAVTLSRPDAGTDELFAHEHEYMGSSIYVYRGQAFQTSPRLSALLDRYVERLGILVGADAQVFPAFHYVAGPDCDVESLRKVPIAPVYWK